MESGAGMDEFSGIPADTTPEAHAVQVEMFRRMDPADKLKMAMRMSDGARELSCAGVRLRHPEYSADQVRLAVNRLMLGDTLFAQVYPGVTIEP